MNAILEVFKNTKVFTGYLTVGVNGVERSVKEALSMINGGLDILELGVPFSDPIGDGAVIQKASAQALINKITPYDVLYVAKAIRKKTAIPLILMSYYNPILQAGDDFYKKAKNAGVDGMLIVDLPIEESYHYLEQMEHHGLSPIFLVTPTTSQMRLQKIVNAAKGFIYYACQKGTTGVRKNLPTDVLEQVKWIKSKTDTPVVVGFGIGSKEDAKKIIQVADGFVVGSAFVQLILQKKPLKDLESQVKRIKP